MSTSMCSTKAVLLVGIASSVAPHVQSLTLRHTHAQDTLMLKTRNYVPEGLVGAEPKPHFRCANNEAPEWNWGSYKQASVAGSMMQFASVAINVQKKCLDVPRTRHRPST